MSRVRLVTAATFAIVGVLLAGCSSTSVPSWLQSTPPPPPTQALQFQSNPPGADVRTADGQTCKTPCSLALPLTAQTTSFAMTGYLPQTVPIQVQQTDPPTFAPNPVMATLQSAEPKPKVKPKPHKAKTAKSAAPKSAAPAQDNVFPPPPAPAASTPYPAAPQPMQPAAPSPFPPPPSQHQ